MAKDFYLYPTWSDEDIRDWMANLENKRGKFTPLKLKALGWIDLVFVLLILAAVLVFLGNLGLHELMDDEWSSSHLLSLLTSEMYLVFFIWFTGLFTVGTRFDEAQKYFIFKKVLKLRGSSASV